MDVSFLLHTSYFSIIVKNLDHRFQSKEEEEEDGLWCASVAFYGTRRILISRVVSHVRRRASDCLAAKGNCQSNLKIRPDIFRSRIIDG
jgi:hypothetical protein